MEHNCFVLAFLNIAWLEARIYALEHWEESSRFISVLLFFLKILLTGLVNFVTKSGLSLFLQDAPDILVLCHNGCDFDNFSCCCHVNVFTETNDLLAMLDLLHHITHALFDNFSDKAWSCTIPAKHYSRAQIRLTSFRLATWSPEFFQVDPKLLQQTLFQSFDRIVEATYLISDTTLSESKTDEALLIEVRPVLLLDCNSALAIYDVCLTHNSRVFV